MTAVCVPPAAPHEKGVCEGGTAMLASLNHEKAVWSHGIGAAEAIALRAATKSERVQSRETVALRNGLVNIAGLKCSFG